MTQHQIGPLYCCGIGSSTGNGSNSVSITETGHQETDSGGSQFNYDEAACRSSGTCSTHQAKDNNTDSITVDDSCEGSVESPCIVDRAVECSSEGCTTFPVSTESGSPDSSLTKDVRNLSAGQTEYTTNTTVGFGSNVQWRITYSNSGTGTAHGVTINDVVPSNVTFTSCTGGCVYNPDNRTITWLLGDQSPDSSTAVTFTGVYGESCSGTSNTATGFSNEEEGFSSNSSTLFVLC